MPKEIAKFALLLGSTLIVSGCGETTTPDPTPVPPPDLYETLSSSASTTSDVGGVGIRTNGSNSLIELVTHSGSLTHNTGAFSVVDDQYTLTDSDGPNSGGTYNDGSGGTVSQSTSLDSSSYDYAKFANQAYQSSGISYDVGIVYGIITDASDVPSSGSANYSGDAFGEIVTSSAGYDLSDGNSSVDVDFGLGTVDVTLDGFSATNSSSGGPTTAPIDTILITGMTISGNRFTGGTFSTELSSAVVDVTGLNTVTDSAGAFYGYNSAGSIPDELGGLFVSQGDDGIIVGGFLSD